MTNGTRKAGILERLQHGIVLGAEGYLFELERRGYLQAGAFVPEVVLEYPQAVKELHREFLLAGSEVMVALTYYAHREKLKVIGREQDLEDLNRHAVRLAREVAAEGDALVAGDLSNTWVYDHERHAETAKIVQAIYEEQVQWAVEEGIDFVLAETIDTVGEALIALKVIKQAQLPALITFASVYDTTRDGYAYQDACRMLADQGAEIVGLNCSRGPLTMLPLIANIRQAVSCYVAAIPVPYRTTPKQPSFQMLQEEGKPRAFPIALDPFVQTRFEVAEFAKQAQHIGVNYLGLCCGAAPHHIRAMAEALGRTAPASKYSPDLSRHALLGKEPQAHYAKHLTYWKDEEIIQSW